MSYKFMSLHLIFTGQLVHSLSKIQTSSNNDFKNYFISYLHFLTAKSLITVPLKTAIQGNPVKRGVHTRLSKTLLLALIILDIPVPRWGSTSCLAIPMMILPI